MQHFPEPKHLPKLIPKRDKSSRSKQSEGVRSFDSEGVLFRRKWKEKSVAQRERHFPWTSTRPFVAKAKTKDGLTQTKIVRVESEKPETVLWRTPTPPLFPKGTIKPSENYRKWKEKSPDGGREQPAERSRCRKNRSVCTSKKKKPTVFKPMETIKEGEWDWKDNRMASLFVKMDKQHQRETDTLVFLLDMCDWGLHTITPRAWLKLVELKSFIAVAILHGLAKKRHKVYANKFNLIDRVLNRTWTSRTGHRPEEQSTGANIETNADDTECVDDDETVPTSNLSSEQMEDWEVLDSEACEEESNQVEDFEGKLFQDKFLKTMLDFWRGIHHQTADFDAPMLDADPHTNMSSSKTASGEFTLSNPPRKPGTDKITSGEYVPRKPPKKPGGLSHHSSLWLLISLFVWAEDSGVEEDRAQESDKWGLKHFFMVVLVIVIVDFIPIKRRVRITKDMFEAEAEAFLNRFGGDKKGTHHFTRDVLWQRYKDEVEDISKGVSDPNKILEIFFSKLEQEGKLGPLTGSSQNESPALETRHWHQSINEDEELSPEELFHCETDAFLGRFDFDGTMPYKDVSLALLRKFKEDLGRVQCTDPMVPISIFFSKIEKEIDEIFMSHDGNLEWERAGMMYFAKLCHGYRNAGADDANGDFRDDFCLLQEHDTEVDLSSESTEGREEAEGVVLEIFTAVAKVFFAQIDTPDSVLSSERATDILWEETMQKRIFEDEITSLDPLAPEDQSKAIADFFAELEGELQEICETESCTRREALLLYTEALYQSTPGDFEETMVPDPEVVPNENDTLEEVHPVAEQTLELTVLGSRQAPTVLVEESSVCCETTACVAPNDEGEISLQTLHVTKDDEATETTMGESWDGISEGSTHLDSGDEGSVWACDNCNRVLTSFVTQETRKEQERRLLRQYRDSGVTPKVRRKTRRQNRHQLKMERIQEETKEYHPPGPASNTSTTIAPATVSVRKRDPDSRRLELDKTGAIPRLPAMLHALKQKTRKKHWRQPLHSRKTKKTGVDGGQRPFTRPTVKWLPAILLIAPYCSAADRFAKMRSNKRFKPGD